MPTPASQGMSDEKLSLSDIRLDLLSASRMDAIVNGNVDDKSLAESREALLVVPNILERISSSKQKYFSTRIVKMEHYMAFPVEGLDPTTSTFRGSPVSRVPIIQIFGSTPHGQSCCVHVHGVFPYILVQHKGNHPLHAIALGLDKAINASLGRTNSSTQHVYSIQHVSGRPLYGYHNKEEHFVKIFFYNPSMATKAVDLLRAGCVLSEVSHPLECHVPYKLKFMMDYNLHGMNMMHASSPRFRKGRPVGVPDLGEEKEPKDLSWLESVPKGPSSSSQQASPVRWDAESIERLAGYLPETVQRQASCELELDVRAEEILNPVQLAGGVSSNPGLAYIWDDELERRQQRGVKRHCPPEGDQDNNADQEPSSPIPSSVSDLLPPDSPPRPNVQPSPSEKYFLQLAKTALKSRRQTQIKSLSGDDGDVGRPSSEPPDAPLLHPATLPQLPAALLPPCPASEHERLQEAEEEEAAVASSYPNLVNEDLAASFSQVDASLPMSPGDISVIGHLDDLASSTPSFSGSTSISEYGKPAKEPDGDSEDESDEAVSVIMSQRVWLTEGAESGADGVGEPPPQDVELHDLEDVIQQADGPCCTAGKCGAEVLSLSSEEDESCEIYFSPDLSAPKAVSPSDSSQGHDTVAKTSITAAALPLSTIDHLVIPNSAQNDLIIGCCDRLDCDGLDCDDSDRFSDLSSVDSDFSIDQVDGDPKDHRANQRGRFPPQPPHPRGRFQGGPPYSPMDGSHVVMGYLPPRPDSNNAQLGGSNHQFYHSQVPPRPMRHRNMQQGRHTNINPHAVPQRSSYHNVPYPERQPRARQRQSPNYRREEPQQPPRNEQVDVEHKVPIFKVMKARSPPAQQNSQRRPETHVHNWNDNRHGSHQGRSAGDLSSSISMSDSSSRINVLPVPEMRERRDIPGVGEAVVVPAILSNRPISYAGASFDMNAAPKPTCAPSVSAQSSAGAPQSADIVSKAMSMADLGEFFHEEETPPVASETVIESSNVVIDNVDEGNDSVYLQQSPEQISFVAAYSTVVAEDDSPAAESNSNGHVKELRVRDPNSRQMSPAKKSSPKLNVSPSQPPNRRSDSSQSSVLRLAPRKDIRNSQVHPNISPRTERGREATLSVPSTSRSSYCRGADRSISPASISSQDDRAGSSLSNSSRSKKKKHSRKHKNKEKEGKKNKGPRISPKSGNTSVEVNRSSRNSSVEVNRSSRNSSVEVNRSSRNSSVEVNRPSRNSSVDVYTSSGERSREHIAAQRPTTSGNGKKDTSHASEAQKAKIKVLFGHDSPPDPPGSTSITTATTSNTASISASTATIASTLSSSSSETITANSSSSKPVLPASFAPIHTTASRASASRTSASRASTSRASASRGSASRASTSRASAHRKSAPRTPTRISTPRTPTRISAPRTPNPHTASSSFSDSSPESSSRNIRSATDSVGYAEASLAPQRSPLLPSEEIVDLPNLDRPPTPGRNLECFSDSFGNDTSTPFKRMDSRCYLNDSNVSDLPELPRTPGASPHRPESPPVPVVQSSLYPDLSYSNFNEDLGKPTTPGGDSFPSPEDSNNEPPVRESSPRSCENNVSDRNHHRSNQSDSNAKRKKKGTPKHSEDSFPMVTHSPVKYNTDSRPDKLEGSKLIRYNGDSRKRKSNASSQIKNTVTDLSQECAADVNNTRTSVHHALDRKEFKKRHKLHESKRKESSKFLSSSTTKPLLDRSVSQNRNRKTDKDSHEIRSVAPSRSSDKRESFEDDHVFDDSEEPTSSLPRNESPSVLPKPSVSHYNKNTKSEENLRASCKEKSRPPCREKDSFSECVKLDSLTKPPELTRPAARNEKNELSVGKRSEKAHRRDFRLDESDDRYLLSDRDLQRAQNGHKRGLEEFSTKAQKEPHASGKDLKGGSFSKQRTGVLGQKQLELHREKYKQRETSLQPNRQPVSQRNNPKMKVHDKGHQQDFTQSKHHENIKLKKAELYSRIGNELSMETQSHREGKEKSKAQRPSDYKTTISNVGESIHRLREEEYNSQSNKQDNVETHVDVASRWRSSFIDFQRSDNLEDSKKTKTSTTATTPEKIVKNASPSEKYESLMSPERTSKKKDPMPNLKFLLGKSTSSLMSPLPPTPAALRDDSMLCGEKSSHFPRSRLPSGKNCYSTFLPNFDKSELLSPIPPTPSHLSEANNFVLGSDSKDDKYQEKCISSSIISQTEVPALMSPFPATPRHLSCRKSVHESESIVGDLKIPSPVPPSASPNAMFDCDAPVMPVEPSVDTEACIQQFAIPTPMSPLPRTPKRDNSLGSSFSQTQREMHSIFSTPDRENSTSAATLIRPVGAKSFSGKSPVHSISDKNSKVSNSKKVTPKFSAVDFTERLYIPDDIMSPLPQTPAHLTSATPVKNPFYSYDLEVLKNRNEPEAGSSDSCIVPFNLDTKSIVSPIGSTPAHLTADGDNCKTFLPPKDSASSPKINEVRPSSPNSQSIALAVASITPTSEENMLQMPQFCVTKVSPEMETKTRSIFSPPAESPYSNCGELNQWETDESKKVKETSNPSSCVNSTIVSNTPETPNEFSVVIASGNQNNPTEPNENNSSLSRIDELLDGNFMLDAEQPKISDTEIKSERSPAPPISSVLSEALASAGLHGSEFDSESLTVLAPSPNTEAVGSDDSLRTTVQEISCQTCTTCTTTVNDTTTGSTPLTGLTTSVYSTASLSFLDSQTQNHPHQNGLEKVEFLSNGIQISLPSISSSDGVISSNISPCLSLPVSESCVSLTSDVQTSSDFINPSVNLPVSGPSFSLNSLESTSAPNSRASLSLPATPDLSNLPTSATVISNKENLISMQNSIPVDVSSVHSVGTQATEFTTNYQLSGSSDSNLSVSSRTTLSVFPSSVTPTLPVISSVLPSVPSETFPVVEVSLPLSLNSDISPVAQGVVHQSTGNDHSLSAPSFNHSSLPSETMCASSEASNAVALSSFVLPSVTPSTNSPCSSIAPYTIHQPLSVSQSSVCSLTTVQTVPTKQQTSLLLSQSQIPELSSCVAPPVSLVSVDPNPSAPCISRSHPILVQFQPSNISTLPETVLQAQVTLNSDVNLPKVSQQVSCTDSGSHLPCGSSVQTNNINGCDDRGVVINNISLPVHNNSSNPTLVAPDYFLKSTPQFMPGLCVSVGTPVIGGLGHPLPGFLNPLEMNVIRYPESNSFITANSQSAKLTPVSSTVQNVPFEQITPVTHPKTNFLQEALLAPKPDSVLNTNHQKRPKIPAEQISYSPLTLSNSTSLSENTPTDSVCLTSHNNALDEIFAPQVPSADVCKSMHTPISTPNVLSSNENGKVPQQIFISCSSDLSGVSTPFSAVSTVPVGSVTNAVSSVCLQSAEVVKSVESNSGINDVNAQFLRPPSCAVAGVSNNSRDGFSSSNDKLVGISASCSPNFTVAPGVSNLMPVVSSAPSSVCMSDEELKRLEAHRLLLAEKKYMEDKRKAGKGFQSPNESQPLSQLHALLQGHSSQRLSVQSSPRRGFSENKSTDVSPQQKKAEEFDFSHKSSQMLENERIAEQKRADANSLRERAIEAEQERKRNEEHEKLLEQKGILERQRAEKIEMQRLENEREELRRREELEKQRKDMQRREKFLDSEEKQRQRFESEQRMQQEAEHRRLFEARQREAMFKSRELNIQSSEKTSLRSPLGMTGFHDRNLPKQIQDGRESFKCQNLDTPRHEQLMLRPECIEKLPTPVLEQCSSNQECIPRPVNNMERKRFEIGIELHKTYSNPVYEAQPFVQPGFPEPLQHGNRSWASTPILSHPPRPDMQPSGVNKVFEHHAMPQPYPLVGSSTPFRLGSKQSSGTFTTRHNFHPAPVRFHPLQSLANVPGSSTGRHGTPILTVDRPSLSGVHSSQVRMPANSNNGNSHPIRRLIREPIDDSLSREAVIHPSSKLHVNPLNSGLSPSIGREVLPQSEYTNTCSVDAPTTWKDPSHYKKSLINFRPNENFSSISNHPVSVHAMTNYSVLKQGGISRPIKTPLSFQTGVTYVGAIPRKNVLPDKSVSSSPETNTQTSPLSLVMGTKQLTTPSISSEINSAFYNSLKPSENSSEPPADFARPDFYLRDHLVPSTEVRPFNRHPAQADALSPRNENLSSTNFMPNSSVPYESGIANRRQSVNDACQFMDNINKELGFEKLNRVSSGKSNQSSSSSSSNLNASLPNQSEKLDPPSDNGSTPVVISCPQPSSSWLQIPGITDKQVMNERESSSFSSDYPSVGHNFNKSVSPDDSPINVVDDAPDPLFPNPGCNIPSLNPLVSPKLKENSMKNMYLEGLGKKVVSQLTHAKLDNSESLATLVSSMPGKNLEDSVLGPVASEGGLIALPGHPEESSRLKKFLKRYQRGSVDQPRSESQPFCADSTSFQETFPYFKSPEDIGSQDRHDFSVTSFDSSHLRLENETGENQSHLQPISGTVSTQVQSESSKPIPSSANSYENDKNSAKMVVSEVSLITSLSHYHNERSVISDNFVIESSVNTMPGTKEQIVGDGSLKETVLGGSTTASEIINEPHLPVATKSDLSLLPASTSCSAVITSSHGCENYNSVNQTLLSPFNSNSQLTKQVEQVPETNPSSDISPINTSTISSVPPFSKSCPNKESTNNSGPDSFPGSLIDTGFLGHKCNEDRQTATQTDMRENSSEIQTNLDKDSCLGSLSLMLTTDVLLPHDDSDVDYSCNLKVSQILGRRRHSTSSHSSKSLGCDSRPASPCTSQVSLSPKDIGDTDNCAPEPVDGTKSSDSHLQEKADDETNLLDLNASLSASGTCVNGVKESIIPPSENLRIHSAPSLNDLQSERTVNIPPNMFAVPSPLGSNFDCGTENSSPLKTIEMSSIKETVLDTSEQIKSISLDCDVPEPSEREENSDMVEKCTPSTCGTASEPFTCRNMETSLSNSFQKTELKMTLKTPTKASIKEFPEDLPIISGKTDTTIKKRKLKNSNSKARKPRKSETSGTRKMTTPLTPRTTRSTRGAAKVSYAKFFDNEPATPAGPPVYITSHEPPSISPAVEKSSALSVASSTSPVKKKRGRPKKTALNAIPIATETNQTVASAAIDIGSSENLKATKRAREDGNSTNIVAQVSTAACTSNQLNVNSTPEPLDDGFKLPVHRPLKMTIKRTLSGSRVKYSFTNEEPSVKKQKISGEPIKSNVEDFQNDAQPIFPTNPRDPLGINDADDYSFSGVNHDNFDTDVENMSVADRLRKAKKSNKHHLQMSRKLVKRSIRTPAHDPSYSYLSTPNATPNHFSSAYGSFTPIYTPLHRISYDGPGTTPARIQGGDLKIHLVNKNKILSLKKANKPASILGPVTKKSRKSPKKKKKHSQIDLNQASSLNAPTSASESIFCRNEGFQSKTHDASQQNCTPTELPDALRAISDKDSNPVTMISDSMKGKIILKIPKNILHAKSQDSTFSPDLSNTTSETTNVPVPELSPGKVAPLIIKKDRVQASLAASSTEKLIEAPSYTLSQEGLKRPLEANRAHDHSVDGQRSTTISDEVESTANQSSTSTCGTQRKVSLPLKAELKNQRASLWQSTSSKNNSTSECLVDKTQEAERVVPLQTSCVSDEIHTSEVHINDSLHRTSNEPCEKISFTGSTLQSASNSNLVPQNVGTTPVVSNSSGSSRPIDAIEKELAAIVGDPYMTPRQDLQSPISAVSISKSNSSQFSKFSPDLESLEMSLAAIDGSPIKKPETTNLRINTLQAILLDERAEKLSSGENREGLILEKLHSSDFGVKSNTTSTPGNVCTSESSLPSSVSCIASESPVSSNTQSEQIEVVAEIEFDTAQTVNTVAVPDVKLHKDPKVLVQNLSSNEINSLQSRFLITPDTEPKKLPRSPPKLRNKKQTYHVIEISPKESSTRTSFSKKIFSESGAESTMRSSCPGKIRKIMAERERQRTLNCIETYEFCDDTDSLTSCNSSNISGVHRDGQTSTAKAKLPISKKVARRSSKLSSTAGVKDSSRKTRHFVASNKTDFSVSSEAPCEDSGSLNLGSLENSSKTQHGNKSSRSPRLVPQPNKRRLIQLNETCKKQKCDGESTPSLKSSKSKLGPKCTESKKRSDFSNCTESDSNSNLPCDNSGTTLVGTSEGESTNLDSIRSYKHVSNNLCSELSKKKTSSVQSNVKTQKISLNVSVKLTQEEPCGTNCQIQSERGETSPGITENSKETVSGNGKSCQQSKLLAPKEISTTNAQDDNNSNMSEGQISKNKNGETETQASNNLNEISDVQTCRETNETNIQGKSNLDCVSTVKISRETRESNNQASDSAVLLEQQTRKSNLSGAISNSTVEISEGLTQKETCVERGGDFSSVEESSSTRTQRSRSPNSPRWTFPLRDSVDESAADYKDTLFVMSYLTPRADCGDSTFLPASASLGQTPNYSSSSPASPTHEDTDRESFDKASENNRRRTQYLKSHALAPAVDALLGLIT